MHLLAHQRVLLLQLGVGLGVSGHQDSQLVHRLLEVLRHFDASLGLLTNLD